ncbi:hypothetical protein [Nocardioides lijunqiniae]|nr:hypothetical protein [Nocardioides lijunqiniae]
MSHPNAWEPKRLLPRAIDGRTERIRVKVTGGSAKRVGVAVIPLP